MRILQLYTHLSSHPVYLTKIQGHEGFCQLPFYQIHLATQQTLGNVRELIGKQISFGINGNAQQKGRDFNGIIKSISEISNLTATPWYHYEVEVVSWLWLLTQHHQCRIFPLQAARTPVSAITVLTELLNEYKPYQFDITHAKGNSLRHDFWLQYNETNFAFFSRIIEQQGLFYYIKHERNQHTLVIADQLSAYQVNPIQLHRSSANHGIAAQLSSWKHTCQFIPMNALLNSHDPEQPSTLLTVNSQTRIKLPEVKPHDNYLFTDDFSDRDQGQKLLDTRLAAHEAQFDVIEAASNVMSFAPADSFQLAEQSLTAETNRNFVICELSFIAEDNNLPQQQNVAPRYQNQFKCLPAHVLYRPLSKTPLSPGYQLQEAVVTGAQDEEIHIEKGSYLRVQFRWDQNGKFDNNSSAAVRVMSSWEGHLRVGTPILIGFLQGEIDRPIVLGPLYDQEQAPLFPEKTMSGLKRRKGIHGDDSYYNELRFNDKRDHAQIYLHAAKDMDHLVENDLSIAVKHNETHNVQQNRQTQIENGNDHLVLKQGDLVITVEQGKYTLQIKGDMFLKSDGDITLNAAKAIHLKAGTDLNIDASSTSIKSSSSVSVKASEIKLN